MNPLQFEHLSIPTNAYRSDEVRDTELGCYIGGNPESPYGIQWCRYDEDSPLPERIRTVPHVTFAVEDLGDWLRDFRVLVGPFACQDGTRSAFVEDNGIPIRLLESLGRDHKDSAPINGYGALRYNSCWMPAATPGGEGKEVQLPDLKMYVIPHRDSPFRAGWVRYQADAPYPAIVSRVPHLAFEVDDISVATKGKHLIIWPNSPTPGLVVAFIEDDGAPIEFLQIDRRILPDGV